MNEIETLKGYVKKLEDEIKELKLVKQNLESQIKVKEIKNIFKNGNKN